MKKKWYRIANGALSALLVLLGFEACTENGEDEYGTPIVDYHVVGRVTDDAGKPIEGIRVTARGYWDYRNGSQEQSVLTDKDGRYETETVSAGWIDPQMRIVFEDVDGEANGGAFETDSVMSGGMQKRQVKKGDGNWYEGEFELTADGKLDKVTK
ncbi:MAG: radical SAM-associated putative lipoprotein [Prevotella sp.]|nr:radical SAM-associated putative lipoprotein [Prevotella sp.]